MIALLQILFSLPTVLFTVPMGFVVMYWLAVVLGAADLELFEGAIGGALDGLQGMVETADGAVGAAGASEHGGGGWISGLLRLGRVPFTITATLLLMTGWCVSYGLQFALGATTLIPVVALDGLILAVSLAAGAALTNILSRPLEPVFEVNQARDRSSLVGEECEVSTGRVDGSFGQARAMLEGDDLLFHVRCDSANNGLSRGDRVLIISYDKGREAYVVEPINALLSSSFTGIVKRGASTSSSEG